MSGYVCTTCNREFPEGVPLDALQLTGGRGSSRTITYKFPDGSIHSLKRIGSGKKPKERHELSREN